MWNLTPPKGALGIDDPLFFVQGIQKGNEPRWVGQLGTGGRDLEPVLVVEELEGVEEFALEQCGEYLDGEEISGELGGDPSVALWSQPSTSDDAVQVRVEPQISGPGMKNRCDAQKGSETIGVQAKIENGPGGRLEKQVKEELPIVQH
jgi:hypothetical protein